MTAAWDREAALLTIERLERGGKMGAYGNIVLENLPGQFRGKTAALLRAADAEIARLRAREADAERMAEALNASAEIAESIIACPQGSLWNAGTRPSRLQEAEWVGKREAAWEILAFIAPDRYRAALAAWDASREDRE